MKIVDWDDDNIPDVIDIDDGNVVIEDCKYWFNLEVGDQIHYRNEINTNCYFVVDVTPADSDLYPRGMTLVTIEAA